MNRSLLVIFGFIATLSTLAQGPTIQKYMMFGGMQRSYLVHLPPNYNNNMHAPVVFNLHGSTSTGAQQEFYSGMSYAADTSNFIVVYPDGIGNEWNVGFTGAHGTGLDDVGFISAIIDTVAQLYNGNLDRVYTCGMSDGGFMSYRLACELENRFAAIAAVSGTLADSVAFYCTHTRNIPVLHIHGTADPLVYYAGDAGYYSAERTVNFWMNSNTCSGASDTTTLPDIDLTDSSHVIKIHYGQCGTGTQVLFYKIIDGGHTWPNAPYPYIYGPTNHDIDGSGVIWDFFKQYTLSGQTAIRETKNEIGLNIFPNPTSSSCEFKITGYDQGENYVMNLFDAMGNRVQQIKIEASSTQLDLSLLADGIYILHLNSGTTSAVSRILKQ